jgi:preprotein translocase subunit Sec63
MRLKFDCQRILLWLLTFFLIQYTVSSSSSPGTLSPYDILGIDSKADENAVKKAYRKLAMKVNTLIQVDFKYLSCA